MAFILDDIALSPIKGLLWIAKELEQAAERARGDERERLTRELRGLYMQLETGRIEEAEFEQREGELLDALDALEGTPTADTEARVDDADQDIDEHIDEESDEEEDR
ncbi:MAG: gas vesicle protein GvpG [Planctomycetota bacterium]